MSHHYYYHAAKTIGSGMSITSDDILYTCLPLFHVNAQVCTILTAILFDARVAMYEHFSASTFWDEIRSSDATAFLALGAMEISFIKRCLTRRTKTTKYGWPWSFHLPKISMTLSRGSTCGSFLRPLV